MSCGVIGGASGPRRIRGEEGRRGSADGGGVGGGVTGGGKKRSGIGGTQPPLGQMHADSGFRF